MGWKPDHKRIKPKAGAPPDAQERAHMARVASLPCLVCGARSTVHHVTGYADRIGRIARSHKLVAPLCPRHHQAVYDDASDPQSVERLNHRGFYRVHGIDLYAEAQRLWEESNAG
jgi:hypothetical protein